MCSLEGYTNSVHQEWSEEKTTPRVCVLEHKRYDRCHINHFPQAHSPQKFTESSPKAGELLYSFSDFPHKQLHSLFVTWPCWHVRASPGLAVSCQVVSQSVNRAADLNIPFRIRPAPIDTYHQHRHGSAYGEAVGTRLIKLLPCTSHTVGGIKDVVVSDGCVSQEWMHARGWW